MKLEGHRTNKYLVLSPPTFARLLYQVANNRDQPGARELFVRLAATWGGRKERAFVTFRPTAQERRILRDIAVVPSTGKANTKESRMARKAKAAKAAPVVDDIDELEAELEGLEEVEDIDEPEVEDDDEGEDYSGLTAAQLKALCKERGIKGVDKKNKAALIALLEANDEADDDEDEEEDEEEPDEVEEDEEEEEEDDGLDEMSRAELKAHIKAEDLEVKVFKSDSDEDIVAKIRDASEEDEEEEDEPAPKKAASKGKTKSTGKKGAQPKALTRKLPEGRLGAADVAEMAGTNALAVRNFLRSDAGQAWPKNEALGRYSFTTKQAQAIVKAMNSRTRSNAGRPAKKGTKRK